MLKAKQFVLSIFLLGLTPFVSQAQNNFDIIPKPQSIQIKEGTHSFLSETIIFTNNEFKQAASLFTEHPAIKSIKISTDRNKSSKSTINLLKATASDKLSKNSHQIIIDKNGLTIKAWNKEQIISGIYTIIQLAYLQKNQHQIAYANIVDEPRFSYRGLHLDVSRHFMPLSFVKKYIDIMAIYKFNNLHWHITDAAGWRLEIKKYPELTQKAAWRTHATWKDWWNNGRQYVEKGSPNASGGYYTQQEAIDLVAYASKKGINIIPEIEMPSHSEEVIAVFPELSCHGHSQGEFCIGNEQTFVFLKNVLDEVMNIFPSKYIHIGGDEADKRHWKTCPKDLALMQKEGLKSVDELQSYAIKQMDEYLQSKGRKLIGWDEILEGGLTKGATVMSWRGEEGGIKAANAGHDVIMTPGSHLYFDSYQTDPRTQPEAIGGYLTLDKVYNYDPIPKEIDPSKQHHILGAQANIWTEYVTTPEHVEYMVFPRALALSELNWTEKKSKNWDDFHKRLQSHYRLLQDFQINYYRPSYNVAYKTDFDTVSFNNLITLETEQSDKSKIHFTRDGSTPNATSPKYNTPFVANKSEVIQAAYFDNNIQLGPTLIFHIDKHKAINKPVSYLTPWDGYAAQLEKTMTNGITGGLSYHDKQWQGFTRGIELIVDMEQITEINTVAMNFMQISGPGVYMPGELEVEVSNDNKTFKSVGTVKNTVSKDESKLTFKRFELNLEKAIQTRYIKIKASNPMKGYLFTDEIIVY